jgi:small subunit ribosomal protein S16
MGATKQPSYRVVVADQQSPRNGRFVEIVGVYNPTTAPATIDLKSERVKYWLGVGAQPSESVMQLLKQVKLVDANGKQVQPV